MIRNYPSYLLNVFRDQNQIPIIPVALYGGATNVFGMAWPIYLAVFTPNQLANMGTTTMGLANPLGLIHDMGNPTVPVYLDPSDRAAFPANLTNSCTPVDTSTMLLGAARTYTPATDNETGAQCPNNTDDDSDGVVNDGCPAVGVSEQSPCLNNVDDDGDGFVNDGCPPVVGSPPTTGSQVRHQNPATIQTGYHVQYNLSLRDTDQDGFENSFDTCPTVPNNGDMRNSGFPGSGDHDLDGIDSACDTSPPQLAAQADSGTDNNPDIDADGFTNAGDNCPFAANGNPINGTDNQKESELPATIGAQNSAVENPNPDNGPPTDGIGDVCDSEVGTIHPMQNGVAQSITMSDTLANGRFMIKTLVQAKCFGGTDADGDGYCHEDADFVATTNLDSGVCAAACVARHAAWSGPQVQMDSDSDGFSDAIESYMGTDPTKTCDQTPVPPLATVGGAASGDEKFANWPVDFNDDRLSGQSVVTTFASVFNKATNSGLTPPSLETGTVTLSRWDLNGDGFIGQSDVTAFASVFNKRCGQGAAPPGPYPGMPLP